MKDFFISVDFFLSFLQKKISKNILKIFILFSSVIIVSNQNAQRIESQSFFKNGIWLSKTNLQLVFKEKLTKDIPISFAREQACQRLEKKRKQNIANYLQKKYPMVHDRYKIKQAIFSIDSKGSCIDTVLLKLPPNIKK